MRPCDEIGQHQAQPHVPFVVLGIQSPLDGAASLAVDAWPIVAHHDGLTALIGHGADLNLAASVAHRVVQQVDQGRCQKIGVGLHLCLRRHVDRQ